jgi:acetyl esterase/lipase
MRLWAFVLALPGLLAGCSADMVNSFVSRDDFHLVSGVSYGDGARRTLDLYVPVTDEAKKPVVVFFYGGNWDSGKKEDYLFLGDALAKRGFIVVIPDYRIYPEVRYPAFVEDGASAVRWTLAHIAAYGGDPDKVSVMGHSAGGYIALMLALDGQWLGADRARIKCVVGLAGPYDFLPLTDPELKIIFGTEADLAKTQPISYVDGKAPPVLLVTGRLDRIVSPGNVTRLAARIREDGGKVETERYSLLGHITLIGSFAEPLRAVMPVVDDVTRFLEASGAGP